MRAAWAQLDRDAGCPLLSAGPGLAVSRSPGLRSPQTSPSAPGPQTLGGVQVQAWPHPGADWLVVAGQVVLGKLALGPQAETYLPLNHSLTGSFSHSLNKPLGCRGPGWASQDNLGGTRVTPAWIHQVHGAEPQSTFWDKQLLSCLEAVLWARPCSERRKHHPNPICLFESR